MSANWLKMDWPNCGKAGRELTNWANEAWVSWLEHIVFRVWVILWLQVFWVRKPIISHDAVNRATGWVFADRRFVVRSVRWGNIGPLNNDMIDGLQRTVLNVRVVDVAGDAMVDAPGWRW